jgi:asparagine synthase (glutamine-hydrolysing)
VALITGAAGRDQERARATALAPFRDEPENPQLFVDGPLTVAWLGAPDRSFSESGEVVCLLEGTIYNGSDLERRYRADGPPERLLAVAYKRAGTAILNDLRGDFWLLLWDRTARAGLVVADQLGCRSPYWTRDRGDLLLASEVPELLAAMTRRPGPDPLALAHWLELTLAPAGRTLYAGVRRLPAAHFMALDASAAEPKRYWEPAYRPPFTAPRAELVQLVRSALDVAVRRRLSGAGESGALLSGGLDSSVVAALAAQADSDVRAYSATFPCHPTVDETALIDRTVGRLGVHSTRICVRRGSVLWGALEYMRTWELPPTSPNLFFWIPLFERAAADGVRVMLDGEGGDELFGCSPYLIADRIRRGRPLAALELAQRFPGWLGTPPRYRVRGWLRDYGVKGALPPIAHKLMRRVRGSRRYPSHWILPSLGRAWLESEESAFEWKRLPGPRWWAFLASATTRAVGPALVQEGTRRRAGMAGIAPRHPLVDVDVIELMLRMPPELAFEPQFSRPLLREAAAGLLPDEVRLRRGKSFFDAVFEEALAGPDLPLAREILGAPEAELRAFVDLDSAYKELLAFGPPSRSGSRLAWTIPVWRLLTAECWLRSQADGGFLEGLIGGKNGRGAVYELVRIDGRATRRRNRPARDRADSR